MLKIKDNVDLKELEKYGFKNQGGGYYLLDDYDFAYEIYEREININAYQPHPSTIAQLDILYDLIQAGLVEKVEW